MRGFQKCNKNQTWLSSFSSFCLRRRASASNKRRRASAASCSSTSPTTPRTSHCLTASDLEGGNLEFQINATPFPSRLTSHSVNQFFREHFLCFPSINHLEHILEIRIGVFVRGAIFLQHGETHYKRRKGK